MQSTKKAPLRKEDGTTAAADDVATIAQSGGSSTTQPVSHKSTEAMNTVRLVVYDKYILLKWGTRCISLPCCVTCSNTAVVFRLNNSCFLLPSSLLSFPPPINFLPRFVITHPKNLILCYRIAPLHSPPLLCLRGCLPKGEGDEDPQIKEGNKENKVKRGHSKWSRTGTANLNSGDNVCCTKQDDGVHSLAVLPLFFEQHTAWCYYIKLWLKNVWPYQTLLLSLLIAKVRRGREEEGWPAAQRKRPEQQHQLHSGSLLIGDWRLLNTSLANLPLCDHSTKCLHSTNPQRKTDVWRKTLSSVVLLLAFLHQVLLFLLLKKGTQMGYVSKTERHTPRIHFKVSCLYCFWMVWVMESSVVSEVSLTQDDVFNFIHL